jgi:hypothetical protein
MSRSAATGLPRLEPGTSSALEFVVIVAYDQELGTMSRKLFKAGVKITHRFNEISPNSMSPKLILLAS